MKKLLVLMMALIMAFSFAACGGETDPGASQQTDNPGEEQSSGHTASTDYFYDQYDFTEDWMLPDDGVYTGYNYIDPSQNEAGNEAVTFTVYDMTDEQIQSYADKILEHGYTLLSSDTYSKYTGSATAMIQISRQDDGSIAVTIDPSI